MTLQTCNINEVSSHLTLVSERAEKLQTMCIASYGDESLDGKSNTTHHFFAGCHDPTYQSGR